MNITFSTGAFFSSSKQSAVESVFNPGGTAAGYYKVKKNGVMFFDMQDKPVIFLCNIPQNTNPFFVTCYKTEQGQIRYSYAMTSKEEKLTGLYGYGDNVEKAKEVLKAIA